MNLFHHHPRGARTRGFTLVELLIVIVIIAILAAIVVVSYRGIQQRARDARRVQDVASIRKTLELYKAKHGSYPTQVPNPGNIGWEASTDGTFMNSLSEFSPSLPRDPINDSGSFYAYVRNPAGSQGCPVEAGAFYVLRVTQLDIQDGTKISDLGRCAGSSSLSASRTPTQTQAVYFGFEN